MKDWGNSLSSRTSLNSILSSHIHLLLILVCLAQKHWGYRNVLLVFALKRLSL